jgi:hypothetical protein
MTGTVMVFRKNNPAKRERDFGLENALAGYVRRRWPDKPIAYAAHEWGLSESEASKVVYGNASKNILNKLLHHKRAGFALFVELLCDACSTSLEDHIHTQAERAAHERRQREAEEGHWATLASRLPGDGGDARGLAEPARRRRATDAGVG